jgi:hypothetical protein
MAEIHRRRVLLPHALRRVPDFAISSPNWDTFSRWEWRSDRPAGCLGDAYRDRDWRPVASSSDDDDGGDNKEDDKDEDFHEHGAQGCVYVQAHPPPPPPRRLNGKVSGQIYNGRVIRDDTDDMVNHVVYHYFLATDRGKAYEIPPELTKEEQLTVVVLISQEEERRVLPGYEDALALSVAPPPPLGPPPMQPPCML